MLRTVLICVIPILLFAQKKTEVLVKPDVIVQKQVEAYNAHDVNAFSACYALDAQVIEFQTGKVYDKNNQEIRLAYAQLFKDLPLIKCSIRSRIVQGEYVIDQELVTGTSIPEFFATAIYQVKNEKNIKVWLIE